MEMKPHYLQVIVLHSFSDGLFCLASLYRESEFAINDAGGGVGMGVRIYSWGYPNKDILLYAYA